MGADSVPPVRGRYLIFHLAERAYAVPLEDIEEIVPVAELSSVPGSPSFLQGFLQVDRQLVAVISLRRLLGMAALEWELYTPLVILKNERPRIALEIDEVICIAQLETEQLVPLSEGSSVNDYATAVVCLNGRTVVLLSPERILLDQERRCLAEFAENIRARLTDLGTVSA